MDCLFCRIIAGEIPSNKVYEDDQVYAFRDIAPQAPTHILVIPKEHLSGVSEGRGPDQRLPGGVQLRPRRMPECAAPAFPHPGRAQAGRNHGLTFRENMLK